MDFADSNNNFAKEASCILQVTQREPRLTGEGVIVAILDSGIDFFLPEFQDAEGKTRILAIWDQTAVAEEQQGFLPPPGYQEGVLYTREQINEALSLGRENGQKLVPVLDLSGHGTAVAGVAAGSLIGVAPKADILVIKLGTPQPDSFPRTTQLIRGIDYAVKLGIELNKPVVLNLSFGNTYGDHHGNSLLERFIDNASEIGKSAIIIGSGNEGASRGHTAGIAKELQRIELTIADYETGLSIQLWKHYQDIYNMTIVSPSGERVTLELANLRQADTVRRRLEQTQLLCFLGEPLPYSTSQEIFIDMMPMERGMPLERGMPIERGISVGSYINNGVWRFELEPVSVVTGEYRFYLPSYAVRNAGTGFLLPTPEMTITIPSTSRRAITVGAYDPIYRRYADFSGRGFVYRYEEGRLNRPNVPFGVAEVKPDLTAPGVNISVPVPNGGYEKVSGTSFATPFVSGSAALLMEWGIVRGNDPFLFGQKLKAYLIRGTRPLAGVPERPDSMTGWGTLCVQNSIPL